MRLYLIRHGDPDYVNDCLTGPGREEAQALAGYLRAERIERLYSSPLGRARETAAAAAEALGLPVEILPWTRELRSPRLNGTRMPVWDMPAEEARRDFLMGTDWEFFAPRTDVAGMRAIWDELVQESDAFLAGLGYRRSGPVYLSGGPNPLRVAVVCHGGFGLTWLAHLLAIPLPLMYASFVLQTTSVTTLLFEERQPGTACPRCIGFGALPHHYHTGFEPRHAGLLANVD